MRLNAEHAPKSIRKWMGDSVGHWEGDTLVVDTTNFSDKTRFRGSTQDLHVVERFTRADAGTLIYRFTVEDPNTWEKPWTGEYAWPATDEKDVRIRVPRRKLRAGQHPARRAAEGNGRREENQAVRETMKQTLLLAAAALMIATTPIFGHHAFGGEFDPNKPVLLKGPVTKVEWVNPHAWIHLEVTKPDGTKEEWMVEGGTPNTLLRRGVTRESLKVGTVLVIDGYQARDHSLLRANGRNVTYPDGKKLFLGSSGTGAPTDGADPTEPAKPAGRGRGGSKRP